MPCVGTSSKPIPIATGHAEQLLYSPPWASQHGSWVSERVPRTPQVNPTPPSTSFVYLNLSRASPSSTNPSYIGTFWVQYRYTSNSLDWWFRIAPKWVQEAGGNLVTFDYTVTTRGKKLNNYQRHERQRISSIHR